MALTASGVIATVRSQLSDTESVRWTDVALLKYLGLAQKQVVLVRPDASTSIQSVKLAQGAKQSVPTNAYRFLGAVQNLGADGETPGAVIANTDMGLKDAFNPDWRSGTDSGTTVRECLYDAVDPSSFWVYPAAPATPDVYIGVRLSQLPEALSTLSDSLTVGDEYEGALVMFSLGFAYGENSDASDKQLAASYTSQGMRLLGVQTKAEAAMPPTVKEDAS